MGVRSAFEESVRDHAGSYTRINVDEFEPAMSDLIRPPTVGVPLPFEGVSFAGLPVTTEPSTEELEDATTGITPAAFAIAEYGSVVVAGGPEGSEAVSLYPDTHVAVVGESDVLPGMSAAIERLNEIIGEGSTSAVITTGPSATADMGSLVYGAHGPQDVNVVVLADR